MAKAIGPEISFQGFVRKTPSKAVGRFVQKGRKFMPEVIKDDFRSQNNLRNKSSGNDDPCSVLYWMADTLR